MRPENVPTTFSSPSSLISSLSTVTLVSEPPSGEMIWPWPLSFAFQSPLKTYEIQYFSSTSCTIVHTIA